MKVFVIRLEVKQQKQKKKSQRSWKAKNGHNSVIIINSRKAKTKATRKTKTIVKCVKMKKNGHNSAKTWQIYAKFII